MDSMEKNKIFAAVLCAGIMAMLSGFIAGKLVHPHIPDEDAVPIEGVEVVAGGGPAKPQLPDPIMDLIAEADISKGEKLSKACAACHSFDQGGPHRVGPNLYGLVGGPKAHAGDFEYSVAMQNAGGAWGYEDLNFFLWKPKKYIEGTKMNYLGLKKPSDRAAMIAWLRQQGSSSFPLPSAGEIEAEKAALAPPEPEEPEAEESADASEAAPASDDAAETEAEAEPAAH
ncbi:MAG: cytochrome c family protein [Alphaproteobacteria bacterium]|nr:cytochrome c family protein [Alphaproteobacteria bacterium]